ncbi:MAG: sugar phosphate isomerase/epimerase family protein [Anaerolineae bacterium]
MPAVLLATGVHYLERIDAAFSLALDAGCDGLELDIGPDQLLRGLEPVRRLMAATGLPVRAVHPPLYPLPGWHREPDTIVRLAEAALALDTRTLVLHPPRCRDLAEPRLARFAEALCTQQARLAPSGARIVLENPGFFRCADASYPLWHVPALNRLAEECGLLTALDTAHAGSSPLSLMDTYAHLRGRLAHVHLSDLRPTRRLLNLPLLHSFLRDHQLPGAGMLPLQDLLRALATDGYTGDITLELSPVALHTWHPAEARQRLAGAVAAVRTHFAAKANA